MEPDNHIQIVDLSSPIVIDIDSEKLVSAVTVPGRISALCSENGEVIRSFRRGYTTPLDQWTFGWLMTGNDERPVAFTPEPVEVVTANNYPLRGNHWSVDGNWNPSRELLIQHLRTTHGNQLLATWNIETWSDKDSQSCHVQCTFRNLF